MGSGLPHVAACRNETHSLKIALKQALLIQIALPLPLVVWSHVMSLLLWPKFLIFGSQLSKLSVLVLYLSFHWLFSSVSHVMLSTSRALHHSHMPLLQ